MKAKATTTDQIRQRLKGGEKPADIADALGVSLRRVYQVRGEKKREPMTDEKAQALRAAFLGGKSIRAIVAEFKISKRTAAAMRPPALEILPIPAGPRGRMSDQTIAHILSRSRAGRSVGTIAKECELQESAVRGVLARHAGSGPKDGDVIMLAAVEEMDRRGLSPHAVAKSISPPMTREYLSDCLSGRVVPSSLIASRILAALGLGVARAK